MILRGQPASGGRAAGRAWRLVEPGAALPSEPAVERVRLESALRLAEAEIATRRDELARAGAGDDLLLLLDAYRLMLRDPLLAGRAGDLVGRGARAAEALALAADEVNRRFRATGDEVLLARVGDVEQVRDRVIAAMGGVGRPAERPVSVGRRSAILVAHDLAPEALLRLAAGRRSSVRAVCLETGGPLAHVAIVARHFGIPMVVGLGAPLSSLTHGEGLLVDGDRGEVVARPDARAVSAWRARRLSRPVPPPPESPPPVRLLANLHLAGEAALALSCGADGVGLLRTDALLGPGGDGPSEDEQARLYGDLARAMGGRPVAIRIFDDPSEGPNPALGLRGIRWMVARPDRLRRQLRALCRAAAEGDVRVLAPMVSRAEEMADLRELVGEVAGELGLPPPQIGAMVETPAAALVADALARSCDFLAIGTNDLLQHLVAADRADARLSPWLDPAHPALAILVRGAVAAAAAAARPIYVCGDLAADPAWVPMLLEAGVRCLSLPVRAIPGLRAWLYGGGRGDPAGSG